MKVLEMERLTRGFGGRPVLRGLDLSIAAGEIAVLVGASGSGKTTLLRIAAALAINPAQLFAFGPPTR